MSLFAQLRRRGIGCLSSLLSHPSGQHAAAATDGRRRTRCPPPAAALLLAAAAARRRCQAVGALFVGMLSELVYTSILGLLGGLAYGARAAAGWFRIAVADGAVCMLLRRAAAGTTPDTPPVPPPLRHRHQRMPLPNTLDHAPDHRLLHRIRLRHQGQRHAAERHRRQGRARRGAAGAARAAAAGALRVAGSSSARGRCDARCGRWRTARQRAAAAASRCVCNRQQQGCLPLPLQTPATVPVTSACQAVVRAALSRVHTAVVLPVCMLFCASLVPAARSPVCIGWARCPPARSRSLDVVALHAKCGQQVCLIRKCV